MRTDYLPLLQRTGILCTCTSNVYSLVSKLPDQCAVNVTSVVKEYDRLVSALSLGTTATPAGARPVVSLRAAPAHSKAAVTFGKSIVSRSHRVQGRLPARGTLVYKKRHVLVWLSSAGTKRCLFYRVKQTYQAVEGGVKQAAKSVNSRFDLKGKAQQTKERLVGLLVGSIAQFYVICMFYLF